MIRYIVFLLFFSLGFHAQITVYPHQKPAFEVHSFEVNERKSMMLYIQNSLKHEMPLAQVDSISIQDRMLIPVQRGKKYQLYDWLANGGDTQLLVRKTKSVRYRGGYEMGFDRYEVAIITKGNTVFRERFTDEKTERSMQKFGGLLPVFQSHFPSCDRLWHQFDPGYDGAAVLGFLKRASRVSCK